MAELLTFISKRGFIYGEVAVSPNGEFTVERDFGPMGNLLLAAEEIRLAAYLVGQFNDWQIGHEYQLVQSEKQSYRDAAAALEIPGWTIKRGIPEETLAKIAIPMPADWRVVWNSGHHRPEIIQELRLWPPARA